MLGHGYEQGRAKGPPYRATGKRLCREVAVQCPVNSPRTRLVVKVSSPARTGYQSTVLFLEGSRLRRNVDEKHCVASINVDLRLSGLCPRGLLVEILALLTAVTSYCVRPVTAQEMAPRDGFTWGQACMHKRSHGLRSAERGGAFGEDRRPILVYLIPTSDRDDIIARLDREVRKMDRENEDLRQQLRAEGYWDRESGNTFARATPTASLERVKAVRMGADILEAPGLRNVRRGWTLTDDNERHLVPAREYLPQVPKPLRTLMAEVFGLDVGFGCKTERHDDGRTLRNSSKDTRLEIKRKNVANRAYFLTTMCLNALLMTNYRAPHEMVLSQTMKSLGIFRSVIGFCAMLSLCIAERGRYDREEIVLRNRKHNELISRDVSVVVEALDNNDIKPTINPVGQDNVFFCAACSVGSKTETLSLCPESEWLVAGPQCGYGCWGPTA